MDESDDVEAFDVAVDVVDARLETAGGGVRLAILLDSWK